MYIVYIRGYFLLIYIFTVPEYFTTKHILDYLYKPLHHIYYIVERCFLWLKRMVLVMKL